MTAKKQREIVIEFERIQLIRKRARSKLAHCSGCGGTADLIELATAAGLFEVPDKELDAFVNAHEIHRGPYSEICINSLLEAMQEQTAKKAMSLIGTNDMPNRPRSNTDRKTLRIDIKE